MPGTTLPASSVAGTLAAEDLADLFTVVLGPGDAFHLTLGSAVDMDYAQLDLREADGAWIDETGYPDTRVLDYTVPLGTAQATYQVRMEHLADPSWPETYDFTCGIVKAD